VPHRQLHASPLRLLTLWIRYREKTAGTGLRSGRTQCHVDAVMACDEA